MKGYRQFLTLRGTYTPSDNKSISWETPHILTIYFDSQSKLPVTPLFRLSGKSFLVRAAEIVPFTIETAETETYDNAINIVDKESYSIVEFL